MRVPANIRAFIVGVTQSGKTTLVKNLLRGVRNFIVYDEKGQYGALGAVVHGLRGLEQRVKEGHKRLIYQPDDLSDEHFDLFMKWVYEHLNNILLVVEEVQAHATPSKITPWFKKIITMCEGKNERGASFIGVWGITQQPVTAHWTLKSQAKVVISFFVERKDAENLSQVKGAIDSNMVTGLEFREFIVYSELEPKDQRVKKFPPIKV